MLIAELVTKDSFMRKKVTIVGSGKCGRDGAHWIAAKELADVVLIDIIEGVHRVKGLICSDAMPIESATPPSRHQHYKDTANSDIVVGYSGPSSQTLG